MIEVEIDKDVYLPCYHHLLEENDIDIELIWGGRDSGKSKFLSQYLPEQSMSLDYFRCIMIKQTHESIKDAQWQMIKDTCEGWNIDHLFSFTASPLSISCVNGNTFLSRGMDKPGKIRSLANPSHAWGEEFNQVSEEGFITLLTGLRNDHGRVKLFLSFNPEAETLDYQDWWLFKMFFTKHYPHTLSFTDELAIKVFIDGKEQTVKLKYRSTHVTYQDNPYITPQRIAFHESLKITNPYWYTVFTEGLFGNKKNDSPWLFTWDREKHVAKVELFARRSNILYLSFDFNRNPQVCTVIQWPEEKKVQIIEVIKIPNVGTEGICEVILQKYPDYLYMVTGDYSGDTTQSLYKEQVTNYTVIKKMLRLNDGQIKIKPNPRLEKNQTLVNAIFLQFPVEVCPVKARPFIFDAENVKKRADGTIVKNDRNDPAQQADVLDCFIGETSIMTEQCEKRIDCIEVGEHVLTRNGYKKVIDKWSSLAEVWEFEFSDGSKVTCTKDHKFFVRNTGFIPIFSIFNNKLSVCQYKAEPSLKSAQEKKGLSITGGVISGIQTKSIFIHLIRRITAGAFTVKNGLMHLVQFLKVLMFTIKITIRSITIFPIMNLNKKVNTKANIQRNGSKRILNSLRSFKKWESRLLLSGTNQKRELNGIGKMPSTVILEIKTTEPRSANYAQWSSKQKMLMPGFAAMHVSQLGEEKTIQTRYRPTVPGAELNLKHSNTYPENTAQRNANLLQTHMEVKVKKLTYKGRQKVYDITVEDEHEFYANKILVHNCGRYWFNMFMGWYVKS